MSTDTRRLSEWWFAPNIGSDDFVEMFKRRGQWKAMRQQLDVFQFYVQNLTDESKPLIGGNSIEAFAEAGAFRFLQKQGIACAVEGALYKEGQDTYQNIRRLMQARINVERAGGILATVCYDEPFRAAKLDGSLDQCRSSFRGWVWNVLSVGYTEHILIEPYPLFDVAAWTDMLIPAAIDAGCEGIHIDVDLQHAADMDEGNWYGDRLLHDVQNIADVASDAGLTVGLILTGNAAIPGRRDDVSSSEYCSALRGAVRAYAKMNLTNFDRVITQSWHRNGEDTSVPLNLPDHVAAFVRSRAAVELERAK